MITCHVCGREVPGGEFCGACGAHLPSETKVAARRWHAYAADPSEHVLQFNVISTLLPHLPHRRSAPFRIALLLTAVLLVALGLLRLTGAAVATAALAVPCLYLLYLYEVEVYEDEPVWVLGWTLLLGSVLGIGWAFLSGPLVTQTLILNVSQGPDLGAVILAGVIVPLVAQLLMLGGALAIYVTRPRFKEALDGFTFGAAGALAFTFWTTVINLFPELRDGLISQTPPLANALEIVQRGLLIPLLNASTTGLIAASLWAHRKPVPRAAHWSSWRKTSVVIAAALQVGLGLLSILVQNPGFTFAIYLLSVAGLLLWVRIALHYMLLAEAVSVEIGPDLPCSHCHHVVPRMAFCPHCGIATRATPKRSSEGLARTVEAN